MSSSPGNYLFFSSPQRDPNDHPADQVPIIVSKAQLTKTLNPVVASVLKKPEQKALFLEVFTRHVNLLKSRSQAFEDGHITVYDKALLNLTKNGNDLESIAAIEFFCEEFLAMDRFGDEKSVEQVLKNSIALRGLLLQASSTPSSYFGAIPATKSHDQPVTVVEKESLNMEPKLDRLWSVYENAKADYLAVSDESDVGRKVAKCRFLRDTAENTIEYLKNKTIEPAMMADLEGTYKMAKATMVSLTGGRKRKFDNGSNDRAPQGTPRGPSKPASQPASQPARRARYGSASHTYEDANRGSYMSGQGGQYGYEYVGEHGCQYGMRHGERYDDYDYEYDDGQSRSLLGRAPPSRAPRRYPPGYSRDVDSYHPY